MITNETTSPETENLTVAESKSNTGSEAMSLVNIDNLIKNHLQKIENLTDEVRKHTEMLEDILINSEVYAIAHDRAKDAAKEKSKTKSELLKEAHAAELSAKVRNMKSELKEHRESLGFYVGEYQKLSGANQIEDNNGEIRDIVSTTKLVKRKNR